MNEFDARVDSPDHPPAESRRLLVVGVGAPPGSFEALEALLNAIPDDAGLALVVVADLDLNAERRLIERLGPASRLPVRDAQPGDVPRADAVLVVPARRRATLEAGVLRFAAGDPREDPRAPIDQFFHSLAREAGARAAGVLLSGAGGDGVLGLNAISRKCGLALLQDAAAIHAPEDLRAALDFGVAGYGLSPAGIAREVVGFAQGLASSAEVDQAIFQQEIAEALPAVRDRLLKSSGHSFKHYRSSTLIRRVSRRIQMLRLPSVEQYLARLGGDATEADQLFQDVLINVTSFFRDQQAFEVLAWEVLPTLFEKLEEGRSVRVWVPGCSTGEEAYTLAILLKEQLDGLATPPQVLVFATDIDEEALAVARAGVYSADVAEQVTPERLARFFTKEGSHYHVNKELRDLVVFSVHNLTHDPPFSKLDLISCRNLLIYMGRYVQKRLIPLFHYALRPGGKLFLGPSEHLNGYHDLFRAIDAKHRIFERLPTAGRPAGHLQSWSAPPTLGRLAAAPVVSNTDNTYLRMLRTTLEQFAPKTVVVDEAGRLLCTSGNLDKYFTVSSGVYENSVTRLAREGLRLALRAGLTEAAATGGRAVHQGVASDGADGTQTVRVTVQPLPASGDEKPLFYIAFEDVAESAATPSRDSTSASGELVTVIEQLERELAAAREDLERTVQELESANEELKSGNEELLSMNEELETSKDEVLAANEALIRANTDLENLLASTQIATLFLDAEGNLRGLSPAVATIYRVRETDVGRPLTDFTHDARSMPPLPDLSVAAQSLRPIEDEVEMLDGSWYLRRVQPYRTAGGAIEGVVVIFIDVTERKQVEATLRASEERWKHMANAAPVLIWICDETQGCTWFNKPWLDFVGRPMETLLGDGWAADVHPDDHDRCLDTFRSAFAVQKEFSMMYRLRRRDGAYRWMMDNGAPRFSPTGEFVGYIGSCTDVTVQREAEEALTEAAWRKDEFLAMLAHELRNPLAPIRTGLQILKLTGDGSPAAAETREMMERQLSHMVRLVDDLLDVSRITRGKVELKKRRVELRTIVETALEASRPLIDAARHALTVDLPAEPVWLEADETRLAQVLGNLLNNAAKYTPKGGRVSLSARREGTEVVATVADDGLGIPPELLPRLFEPFIQAHQTRDRAQGGLGIGLSLVRRLTEMHGGSVAVASDGLGRGSAFTVRLPIAEAPEARPADDATRDGERDDDAAPRRSEFRVLVVDDNRDAADSLATLLGLMGHVVRTVYSGAEALQVAGEFKPELVFMDLGLPGMNGYEVTAQLRSRPELAATRIAALTGWGSDGDKRKTQAAGFDHHLTKPVEPKDVAAVVRLAVEGRRPARRDAAGSETPV